MTDIPSSLRTREQQCQWLTDNDMWAVPPLLREENVGKYVWSIFNSNDQHAAPTPIVKLGRTNIHLNYGTSVRVDEDGMTAHGSKNGFGVAAESQQFREERAQRMALYKTLDKQIERVKRSRNLKLAEEVVWAVGGLLGDD